MWYRFSSTPSTLFSLNCLGLQKYATVFISDLKQNARSLLTPVSDQAFLALSNGGLSFALHDSFLTVLLLVPILQQPIRIFEISGYLSCYGDQNAGKMQPPDHIKEQKNLYRKLVSKLTMHFV